MTRKPSLGKRLSAAAMAVALLAGAPAAAVGEREPHRRAFLAAVAAKHRPPKHRPGERWAAGRGYRAHNSRRQDRRSIEALYREHMGRPMSGRTWVRLRRAVKNNVVRINSLAGRFLTSLSQEKTR